MVVNFCNGAPAATVDAVYSDVRAELVECLLVLCRELFSEHLTKHAMVNYGAEDIGFSLDNQFISIHPSEGRRASFYL